MASVFTSKTATYATSLTHPRACFLTARYTTGYWPIPPRLVAPLRSCCPPASSQPHTNSPPRRPLSCKMRHADSNSQALVVTAIILFWTICYCGIPAGFDRQPTRLCSPQANLSTRPSSSYVPVSARRRSAHAGGLASPTWRTSRCIPDIGDRRRIFVSSNSATCGRRLADILRENCCSVKLSMNRTLVYYHA